jgi:hypothetical protein
VGLGKGQNRPRTGRRPPAGAPPPARLSTSCTSWARREGSRCSKSRAEAQPAPCMPPRWPRRTVTGDHLGPDSERRTVVPCDGLGAEVVPSQIGLPHQDAKAGALVGASGPLHRREPILARLWAKSRAGPRRSRRAGSRPSVAWRRSSADIESHRRNPIASAPWHRSSRRSPRIAPPPLPVPSCRAVSRWDRQGDSIRSPSTPPVEPTHPAPARARACQDLAPIPSRGKADAGRPTGTRVTSERRIRSLRTQHQRRAGLRRIPWHGLRHSFARMRPHRESMSLFKSIRWTR